MVAKWPNGIPNSGRRRKPTARLNGFTYTGNYTYLITICTDRSKNLFVETDLVENVTLKLIETAKDAGFTLLCYCFMPDHLHFLCTGDDAANLKKFVQKFKSSSAYYYKKRYGDRLWQRGYYDRILREADDHYFAVEYIMDNPVRAGLTEKSNDYAFSKSFIK